MVVSYSAKSPVYNTDQFDMWDIIALREYGDEHAMNVIQDANYYLRFTDAFLEDVQVVIPEQADLVSLILLYCSLGGRSRNDTDSYNTIFSKAGTTYFDNIRYRSGYYERIS